MGQRLTTYAPQRYRMWAGLLFVLAVAPGCQKDAAAPSTQANAPTAPSAAAPAPSAAAAPEDARDAQEASALPQELQEDPDMRKADVPPRPKAGGEGTDAGALSTDSVKAAIAQARACTRDEECVPVGSLCPFGCNIVVNRAQALHIRELMSAWQRSTDERCVYRCRAFSQMGCFDGQCGTKD